MKRDVKVFIEGIELDLFEDEQVQISSSVQDVYDINKTKTEISQSFTVPATPRNNQVFQHFYETDVDSPIDHNLRRDGYIEIDLTTYKSGKIQLEKSVVEKGKAKSYTITFYGKLVTLKDLFSEDKLADLDYSTLSHTYNWAQVFGRINGSITSDVQYPLITSNRIWEYGGTQPTITNPNYLTATTTNNNIHTSTGAINVLRELFPAITLNKLINLIELKYNVTFNSSFFSTEEFRNVYLWFKNRDVPNVTTDANFIDLDAQIFSSIYTFDPTPFVDISSNTVNVQYQVTTATNFTITLHRVLLDVIFVSSTTTQYYVDVYVNGVLTATHTGINGTINGSTTYGLMYAATNVAGLNDAVQLKVRADEGLSIDFNLIYQIWDTEPTLGTYINSVTYSCSTQNLISNINLSNFAPDMKVVDFMSGILKEFNLVVENTGENEYTIEPLLNWYTQGSIYDITRFTDVDSIEVAKVPLYKKISFKYETSESVLNKYYFQSYKKEYGNTEHIYSYDGAEYSVQVPFENLMFNHFFHSGTPSGLQVGYALNSSLAPYIPKPVLLYRYGNVTGLPHDIHFKDAIGNNANIDNYVMFGQDYTNSTTGVQYSLNFAPETSTYHLVAIQQSIFATYYFQYLYNLYNLKNRITTVKTVLPISILTKIRLCDRVIIRDKRFIINDMQINLTTGEATLRLLNDFMPIDPESLIPPPSESDIIIE